MIPYGQYGYPIYERPLPWYPGHTDMADMPTPGPGPCGTQQPGHASTPAHGASQCLGSSMMEERVWACMDPFRHAPAYPIGPDQKYAGNTDFTLW